MLHLSFDLINPFAADVFENIWARSRQISEWKALEGQFYFYPPSAITFSLDLRWFGHDHAGPSIEFGIMGWTVTLKMYDIRHWDDYRNCWSRADEEDDDGRI